MKTSQHYCTLPVKKIRKLSFFYVVAMLLLLFIFFLLIGLCCLSSLFVDPWYQNPDLVQCAPGILRQECADTHKSLLLRWYIFHFDYEWGIYTITGSRPVNWWGTFLTFKSGTSNIFGCLRGLSLWGVWASERPEPLKVSRNGLWERKEMLGTR